MSLTGLLGRKKPPSKTACCLVAGAGHKIFVDLPMNPIKFIERN